MDISPAEATHLYAESSVADYVPEPITVEISDGSKVEASCYILPRDKVTGTNKDYAEALVQVAGKIGLPESYLAEITQTAI